MCMISPQLHQVTTVNGQGLESQRTTFVKQLKLGKVRFYMYHFTVTQAPKD